ncbi:hypothetical protein FYJ38_19435 [Clostridium sp. WB02_MRS01]|uniref:hypothetical protein n=1 Tax=Clostridium sp. WB02_MRS01 TaxID=2605777 RepID=UPI0012B21B20|nr:hypothetical protein [Clostridium sp. WB02_MRS01]MSS10800.1 hypothetical protein [Clostridium sp. WB02_MRS01]
MKQIDIKKIIEEIREEIKEKGYTKDLLSFSDSCIADGSNLEEIISLAYLTKSRSQIDEYPVWEQGSFSSKIKTFIKKTIRKSMKFYIVPIVEKQNLYNELAADRIVDLCKTLQEKDAQIRQLQKQLKDIEKAIREDKE